MPTTIRILLFSLVFLLTACEQTPLLERIRTSGTLKVGTTVSPTTYYQGEDSLAGFEYELVEAFAEKLGLSVEFVLYRSEPALLRAVRSGGIHMVASGMTRTEERDRYLAFSTPYQEVEQQLLYRRGSRRPKNLDELAGAVTIPALSSYEYKLQALKRAHPDLQWQYEPWTNTEDMLARLNNAEIHYTIADSNQAALYQAYFPHIKPAINLPDKEQIAWAFPRTFDSSLVDAANQFLQAERQSGRIEALQKKYYSDISSMSFVDDRDFWRNVEKRLPKYESLFKEAAKETQLDWRLLAAIGYQESHWDKKAVSPTGVRGIMMLTKDAASQLGVTDRSDPEQSIMSGARYVLWKMERIPPRIQGKDRLWLGLAAYNIGYGHLEDARVLTQRQGGNPDKWEDVKQRLPLLKQKKYYSTLQNGYARGGEPVVYVANIQHYYRLLIWHSNRQER